MPIPLAVMAGAMAAMKVGKAVANAASPTGGSATPETQPINTKPKPSGDKYSNQGQQPTTPQPRTEAQVTTGADGTVNTGESVPIQDTGGEDNYQAYKARTQTTSATRFT
jgi:hypothetical protein